MPVGRCYSELFGHRPWGKLKKSQPPTEANPDFLPRSPRQGLRCAPFLNARCCTLPGFLDECVEPEAAILIAGCAHGHPG